MINYFNDLQDDINNADYVVISLGKEVLKHDFSEAVNIINDFVKKISGKNYFVISSCADNYLRDTLINEKRLVCPLNTKDVDLEEKQWDFYNKWLASSIAKSLLIIELGEGFEQPNFVKWPFERITMINQKAKMYRIHSQFYQVPPEISAKAVSIECDAFEFIKMF